MSSEASSPTRREFLIGSAGATCLAALPARSYARVLGANDRIRIGMIGTSPYTLEKVYLFLWLRKKSHNCAVTAVCDVYEPNLRLASEKTGGKPVKDYRRILDDPDIDAVVIAAPDHWHAKMAIAAAEAKKGVYLEAPFTRTWEEAVELRTVLSRNKTVFQCGAQFTSDDRYHQARQLVDGGAIGTLLYCQTIVAMNSRMGYYNRPVSSEVTPANLDWRMWLGPAPYHDFDADRFVRWRKYWDYSGGVAANLLFQSIAVLLVAIGNRVPRRVTSGGGAYLPTSGESPDTYFSVVDYPDCSLQLSGCLGNEQSHPTVIRGHEGSIRFEESIEIVRERYFVKEYNEREAKGLFNVTETTRPDHVRNWLECLRTGEQPVCHEEIAEAATIAAHLGELAYRKNRTMLFDSARRRLVDSLADKTANRRDP